MLLTDFLRVAYSACSRLSFGTRPEVVPPLVGWAHPHDSTIKKMEHGPDEGISSTEVPSSKITLACVKLTQKLRSTDGKLAVKETSSLGSSALLTLRGTEGAGWSEGV